MLALDACLYLFAKTLLLAFVLELGLVVQPSKICNFRSSSDNIAGSVCHCLFTRQGMTARRGLSTGILSVTFPWHTASRLQLAVCFPFSVHPLLACHLVPPPFNRERGVGAATSLAQDSVITWVNCQHLCMVTI